MKIEKVTQKVIKLLVFDAPIVAAAALSSYDPTMAAAWLGITTMLNRITPGEKDIFFEELFRQEIKEELRMDKFCSTLESS